MKNLWKKIPSHHDKIEDIAVYNCWESENPEENGDNEVSGKYIKR